MQYPEDLEIPFNVVQQIQISHDFIESNITIQEDNWNSVSHYNGERSIVIVLVLDKYDDASDYLVVLEEFNSELRNEHTEDELLKQLERIFDFSKTVFRTRDEVISKLSNELAEMKMYEYDIERKFDQIAKSEHLNVKSKVLFLLAIATNVLSFKELRDSIKTSKRWLEDVIETLLKNEIIKHDLKTDGYFLVF